MGQVEAQRSRYDEDDVLGKAYDARLMRRLLRVSAAVLARGARGAGRDPRRRGAAAGAAVADAAGDRRLHPGAATSTGCGSIAVLYLATLVAEFVLEFVQTGRCR